MTHITDRFRPKDTSGYLYVFIFYRYYRIKRAKKKNQSAFIMSECRRIEVRKLRPISYQGYEL